MLEAKDQVQAQVFSKTKKGLQNFSQVVSERGKHKNSSKFFCKVSGVFQQTFNSLKTSDVLEPRTG